jgi:malate dehydrogenase (oxaloacetate-decarboxylating)
VSAETVSTRSEDSFTKEPHVDPVFALHRGGKMEIAATVPVRDCDDLSLACTPGVAKVCTANAEQPDLAHEFTWTSNVVAVITDGTAVLGLGDIGPRASMPVMEGKAILFKQFAGVDAVPIALATTDPDEMVETVVRLAPSFGGINLEDISAPRCFEIEHRLKNASTSPSSTTTGTAPPSSPSPPCAMPPASPAAPSQNCALSSPAPAPRAWRSPASWSRPALATSPSPIARA